MQNSRWFDVYTSEGTLILRVSITEREGPETQQVPESTSGTPVPKEGGNGETMTAPQKRLLFRLMAARGIEGEKAHDELKKLFRVRSLQDVTKREASRAIDSLMEKKGA